MAKGAPTEKMQKGVDQLSDSCDSYDQTIIIKKTEVVYQPAPGKPYKEPTITVKGQRLQVVEKFTYLGSTLSRVVHIDDEVNASAAFGRLRGIFGTEVESDLTQSWKYTDRWCCQHYSTHGKLGQFSNSMPKGELQVGKRSHGGQKKRYKYTLKASFKDLNIPTESWEQIAQDRTKWRGLIRRGAGEYEAKRISENEQKRAQRKARAKASPTELSSSDLSCSVSKRQFGARIGLINHLRTHK